MDIEIDKIKRISFFNVATKKQYVYILEDEHKHISILTWHILIEIIELYEPKADLNKLLMQVKIGNKWKYVTSQFSISVRMSSIGQKLEVRYKVYDRLKLKESMRQQTEANLLECLKDFEKYEEKFNLNKTDINIIWASPIYALKGRKQRKLQVIGEKAMLRWRVSQQTYVKQIAETLTQSKKRIFIENKLFNENSFKHRNQYSIVYLLCHTQTYSQSKGEKEEEKKDQYRYFVGETELSQLREITPQKLQQMLKGKEIQLLILHTSYPYFHLEMLQNCNGIHNILLINSNPLHDIASPIYFLKVFFENIVKGKSIKQAHKTAIKELTQRYPNDSLCCCYHTHSDKECIFTKQLNFTKYASNHYKFHKIEQKMDNCCINMEKAEELHSVNSKYALISKKEEYGERKFEFENGQLVGDATYLKSFPTRQNLLGNQIIFVKALQMYNGEKNKVKNKEASQIFNIYTRIQSIKETFAQNLANFLIRRKVFKSNQIQILSKVDFNGIKIRNNPQILYTFLCDKMSGQEMKNLVELKANILVMSDVDLNFKQIDLSYDSAFIQPLSIIECSHYIKAQKHLDQEMKDNVSHFFTNTWESKKSQIYYPSNFDYDGIISVIAQSNYKDSDKFFEKFEINVDKNRIKQYILMMSVAVRLPQQEREQADEYLIEAPFFVHAQKFSKKRRQQFLDLSKEYFNLTFQKYHALVEQVLFPLMTTYVKLTKCIKNPNVALYDATTDSSNSLISIYFQKNIVECQNSVIDMEIKKFLQKFDIIYIFQSALTLVRYILTCFYFYNILSINQQQDDVTKMNKTSNKENICYMESLTQNKKRQILILCLLIINNAIVYRKHFIKFEKIIDNNEDEQSIAQQIRKCHSLQPKQMLSKITKCCSNYFEVKEEELENYYPRTSHQIDIQPDDKSQISENESQKKYSAEDLKKRTNYLSIKGLTELLQKIKGKKAHIVIETVAESLSFQLLFESIYSAKVDDVQKLKKAICGQIILIKKWSNREIQGKLKLIYDMIMSNILIYTEGGRKKLTWEAFNQLRSNYKIAVDNSLRRETKQESIQKQKLKIIEKLCSSQQIYVKLIEYIQNCSEAGQQKEQELISGFEEAVNDWQHFAQIKKQLEINRNKIQVSEEYVYGTYYLRLLKLINQVSYQIRKKDLSSYASNMLQDLKNQISAIIDQMKNSLIVVMVAAPINDRGASENKFMINFQALLSRKYEYNDDLGVNQHSFRPPQKIAIAKMLFNSNNLSLLSQWGCKYLVLNASTSVTNTNTLIWMGENQKTGKVQPFQTKELVSALHKIKCDQIFLCVLKSNDLRQELRASQFFPKIIYFDYYTKPLKVDEGEKNVFMVSSSILMAWYINRVKNFEKAFRDIAQNLQIRYLNNENSFECKVLIPKVIKQIIKYDQNTAQPPRSEQSSPLRKQIIIKIQPNIIIKQQYLKQIQNINNLHNIEDLINCNRKHISNLNLQNFIQYYKFYIKQRFHLNVHIIEDSEVDTKIFEKFLKLLPTYHLSKEFVLFIKGYTNENKLGWMKKTLGNFIFGGSSGKFENRCIQIGNTVCIICIKRINAKGKK